MGKSANTPAPPDPNVTIPLQTAANLESFNRMLEAQRVNQVSPYGTQSWDKTPVFDRQGFRKAREEWRNSGSPATPGSPGTPSLAPQGGQYVNDPNAEGGQVWVPGGSPLPGTTGTAGTPSTRDGPRPTRDDFTSTQWTYNQTLSPEQQAIFDADQASRLGQSETLGALTDRVQQSVSGDVDWNSVPGLTSSVDPAQMEKYLGANGILQGLAGYRDEIGQLNPNAINRRAANAQYRLGSRYLDRQTEDQTKALEARLAEQGFVPGTPGYAKAMETFQDTNARAYADARDRATVLGSQVGNQNFDNSMQGLQAQMAALLQGGQFDMSSVGFNNNTELQQQNADTNAATFGNTARTQGLAELLMQRNQPLNELNAMRTGTQITLPNNPATYGTPNLDTPDILGAYDNQYKNLLGQANADNAGGNAMLGLLGDVAGMSMGAPPGTFSTLLNGFGAPAAPQAGQYGSPMGNYFG